MKATILAALLCTLPTLAAADPVGVSDQPTVRVPARTLDVPAARWSMQLTNFSSYQGAWDLSDGRVLALTTRGGHMYAEIEGMDKRELVAIGSNSFVAVDRSMRLNLARDMAGEVSGEVLLPLANPVAGLDGQLMRLSLR